jgi:hypothetical protein
MNPKVFTSEWLRKHLDVSVLHVKVTLVTTLMTKLLLVNHRSLRIMNKHSYRNDDALAQKGCEIQAEGRGDGSKNW